MANDDTHEISVPIKVLGLWDSVEALGLPAVIGNLRVRFLSAPPTIDFDEPNRRYGEKLCNVQRAYQALCIEDSRATISTPLQLSRAHVFEDCPKGKGKGKGMLDSGGRIKTGALQEVWFSGAHSDVGGGYAPGALSGVSLNWMLNRLRCTGLLPRELSGKETCPRADGNDLVDSKYLRDDALGGSHDPTDGIWSFYPKVSRNLVALAFDKASVWPGNPAAICVHSSVLNRRALIGPEPHEYDQLSLEHPGRVELVIGEYGKGRNWTWLRERRDSMEPSTPESIEIQQYPKCYFNAGFTPVEEPR